MPGRGYIPNTVKGSQRGKAWPPEVQTACLCDMVVMKDLHLVAKRHGVPESTMRGWWKKLQAGGAAEVKKLWSDAQQRAMAEIAYQAAEGAHLSVAMINRKLEIADRNAQRVEEIEEVLLPAAEGDADDEAKERLMAELSARKDKRLHDYPLANYTRTLVSVGRGAYKSSGQDEDEVHEFSVEIQVVE